MSEMNFQNMLLQEFEVRRTKNPGYSLRSYARDVEIPSSKLSRILRKGEGISPSKAKEICERMRWSEQEKSLFTTADRDFKRQLRAL